MQIEKIEIDTAEIFPAFGVEVQMLWAIVVILVVLWLLGLLANVGGGLIHALLVIALIVIVVNLVRGRRPLG